MSKFDINADSGYEEYFQKASQQHGIPLDLLKKISWIESRYNPDAKSPTGATGIMQFTKATGRAMGLRIDGQVDERRDPSKAIDAAARHISDLYKKYDGDYSLIGLEYNQGAGKLGKPQLEAFRAGRLNEVSEEGRKYIELLTDKQISNTGVLNDPLGANADGTGITPLSPPIKFTEGDTFQTTEVTNSKLYTMGILNPDEHKTTPYRSFYGDEPQEVGMFDGTWDAIKASAGNTIIGNLVTTAVNTSGDFDGLDNTFGKQGTYAFSKEEEAQIRKDVNVDYLNVIAGANSAEDLQARIKLAKENEARDRALGQTGIGAQLVAGLATAPLDPTTWIPVAGAWAKTGTLIKKAASVGLQAGAWNAVSEDMRTAVVGGDTNYSMAFMGGALFGGSMTALSHTVGKYKGLTDSTQPSLVRAELREQARIEGIEDASLFMGGDTSNLKFDTNIHGVEYAKHPTEKGAVVLKDGTVISAHNPINPETIKQFQSLQTFNGHKFDPNLTGKHKYVGGFKKNRQVKGMTLKGKQKQSKETVQTEYQTISPEQQGNTVGYLDNEIYTANRGFDLGGVTELAYAPFRSQDEEVRGLASVLMRPSTGATDGSSGLRGATVEDILSRETQLDNVFYEKASSLSNDAYKEYRMTNKGINNDTATYEVNRKVVEAIEDPNKYANLTQKEKELADTIRDHLLGKEDSLASPSKYGNINAKPVLEKTSWSGKYFPAAFDKGRKAQLIHDKGADVLEDAYTRALILKYDNGTSAQRAAIEDFYKWKNNVDGLTRDDILEEARKNAYAVIKNDEFTISSTIDDQLEGLVGIERNNFMEARQPFGYDGEVQLPDGTWFSPNDIRNFDIMPLLSSYNRRVNGDVAIMGATGKTTKELKEELIKLRQKARNSNDASLNKEVGALEEYVKLATGRARRNPDTLFEMGVRAVSSLSLVSKGFYIPFLNYSEIASMFVKNNLSGLFRNVPIMREMVNLSKKMTNGEVDGLRHALFGKELTDVLRPSLRNTLDNLRNKSSSWGIGKEAYGRALYGTQELVARFPHVKWISSWTNHIIDSATSGFVGDIVTEALVKGAKPSKWNTPEFRKAASITDAQYSDMLQVIRDHAVLQPDGTYSIKDKVAFRNDPRSFNIWRMGDRVAHETILRPHRTSMQDTKAYGAIGQAVLQFKKFTIKSLNSRTVEAFYQATKNDRTIEMALNSVVSMGLATLFYIARVHVQAAQMDDPQSYKERAFDPNMMVYNATTRSSVFAGAGVLNILLGLGGVDAAKELRTSITPRDNKKSPYFHAETGQGLARDIATNVSDQIPTLSTVGNALAFGSNAAGYMESTRAVHALNALMGMKQAMQGVMPNDPLSQWLVSQLYADD
ncbi:internal virion protein D [Pasteurella phage vB_PmuP_PHB02]|uniref:Peptidoglycan transglycosylase gp16 n=1 Tax=Pasteurella phage vB_PmuP_PHB02 TaxID=2005054 RepID=A0A1Y0SVL4_9CAUD|nr:internal virion protein with endolysin domain [Pasteurella phage vB_PmuP_PHB02]ARV77572.1 internal virion protein D [Pasteurella phage vB_PmuP_PHB02]